MEKHIIGRGLLAGAAASVIAFVFARVFIEPVIDEAIAYEDGVGSAHEALDAAAGAAHSHGEDGGGFSRAVQMNIGMGLGVLVFCLAMGALFAVAFAVAHGRVGAVSARLLSLYIAGGMLLSLFVVPFLKYPASPPASSLDETIRQRTLLYLLMVVLSGLLLIAAVLLGRRLAPRLGGWNATLAAACTYLAASAVLIAVFPAIDETPGPLLDDAGSVVYEGFPADVLYEFRLYAVGEQLLIWATIGLVFGTLISRLLDEKPRRSEPIGA